MSEPTKGVPSHWEEVAKYADDLIATIGTPEAVRLAAEALWKADQLQKCIEILDKYTGLFPGNSLPSDLRKLSIYCQARTGSLASAIENAQGLLHQDNSTGNLLTLMQLKRQAGDLKGLVIDARTIVDRPDVSSEDLLRVASFIKLEDATLARALWHRAKSNPVDDPEFLAVLITQGFELGLDDEVSPLFIQARKYAEKGEGPLKIYDIDQFGSWATKRYEFVKEVNVDYEQGVIPIHFVSKAVNVPLADVFHGIPEYNRTSLSPTKELVTFYRHGGKPVQEQLAVQSHSWRLHVDTTALLLAADLGILETVESCFKPLRISQAAVDSLILQRKQLTPHQPSHVSESRGLIRLLDHNKFKLFSEEAKEFRAGIELTDLTNRMGATWTWALSRAIEGAYVVDYLPLTSNDENRELIELPPRLNDLVVNCRAIVDGLREGGRLSDARFDDALKKLGHEALKPLSPRVPSIGTTLFLMGNIASVLEGAEVLDLVCDHYCVFVDPIQIRWARSEVAEQERRSQLESWLNELSDHVSLGIRKGVYEIVVPLNQRQKEDEEESKEMNLEFDALRDLFTYESKEGDVLWIDDRFVNSYSNKDGIPIVGVNEVLLALRSQDKLSEEEYYGRLLDLRTGNFRYVPLSSEEILYHLAKSQIGKSSHGQIVTETQELAVIRRHIAASLLDPERLQRPPRPQGAPNPFGEMAFVHNFVSEVIDSIVQVWRDESISSEAARARADWILRNLYTGVWGVQHLTPAADSRTAESDVHRVALDLGGLFAQGMSFLPIAKDGKDNRRKSFFSWLETIASRRFNADTGTLIATGNYLKQSVLSFCAEDPEEPDSQKLARAVVRRWLLDLPDDLQEVLCADEQVINSLQIPRGSLVEIGSVVFIAQSFWDALESVIAGHEKASVTDQTTNSEMTIGRLEGGQEAEIAIEIRNDRQEVVARARQPLWGLLASDRSKREALLKENRFWFDCGQALLDEEIQSIVAIDDGGERIECVRKWTSRSAEYFYRSLRQKLLRHEELSAGDLLPPSVDSVLQHFRLARNDIEEHGFADALGASAAILLREEGVEPTLERLSCLPVRMPEAVIQALTDIEQQQQVLLFESCLSNWASPISLLNLIDAVVRSMSATETIVGLVKRALGKLLDAYGETEFRLFRAILDFVNDEFGFRYRDENVTCKLAAVWAHASRLHNAFYSVGALPERVQEALEQQAYWRQMSIELLSREPLYWNDILHPRDVNRTRLLTHGLAKLLGELDSHLLTQLRVPELTKKLVFGIETERNHPVPEVIRDSTLKTNALGSYLGGDAAAALAPLIGQDGLEALSSDAIRAIIKQAIEALTVNPSRQHEWGLLLALVGDSAIYPELQEPLKVLLENLDVHSVYDVDPIAAKIAVRVAAFQLPYIEDEKLRSRFEDDFLRTIGAEFEKKEKERMENEIAADRDTNLVGQAFDTAFALSARLSNPGETSVAFGRLLQKMITRVPLLADHYGHIVWRLVSELPVSQVRGLWTALLTARASSKNAL